MTDPKAVAADTPLSESFETFFEREVDNIQRSLALTLSDPELAADATAEAMAKAFSRWTTVRSYSNPSGWVFRVGANWAYKRLKRRHRETSWSADLAAEQRTSQSVGLDQSLVEVADALQMLSTTHREVVVLRYVLLLSTAETAEALNIAPGTVQSRLSRASESLRRSLREDH